MCATGPTPPQSGRTDINKTPCAAVINSAMTLYRQPQTRPTADTATLPCLPVFRYRQPQHAAACGISRCNRQPLLRLHSRRCDPMGRSLPLPHMRNRRDDAHIRTHGKRPLPAGILTASLGPDENTLPRAVELLRDCGSPLRFSAIPEDRLHLFAATAPRSVQDLGRDWSDYIYPISALATLSGNRLKRKRNHVNRFFSDHPGRSFAAMTPQPTPPNAALCCTFSATTAHSSAERNSRP